MNEYSLSLRMKKRTERAFRRLDRAGCAAGKILGRRRGRRRAAENFMRQNGADGSLAGRLQGYPIITTREFDIFHDLER